MTEAILAIDGGGTRTKWGIVDQEQIVEFGIVDTIQGSAAEQTQNLLKLHQEHGRNLPIAVDWAGKLNTGCSINDLREALNASALEVALVTDDMIASSLGEAAGRDIALMQIGTGVGGAIVRDDKAVKCITGHIVFREDGIPCSSGMRGTVDTYLGWRGIKRRLSVIEELAELSNPSELLAAAKANPQAAYILEDAFQAAGFAASYLVACSGANTFVLAGGVASAWGETLLTSVEESLSWRIFPARADEVQIELSKEQEKAPLLGLWYLTQQPHLDGSPFIAE